MTETITDRAPDARPAAPVVREKVKPYAWYVLGVLALTQMFALIDRFAIGIVVEPIRIEFQLNDTQLGLLTGFAFSATYALAGIPLGMLVDRVHRRNFLVGVLSIWSALTVVCGVVKSYIPLVIARMGVGAAEGGMGAAPSIIGDYFPKSRRPMAMSFFNVAGSVGLVISFALGGWIAQNLEWRFVFLAAGAPGLVLALVILFTVKEPVRGGLDRSVQAPQEPAPSLISTLRIFSRTPALLHIFVGFVLVAAMASSFWAWIASLFIRVHGLDVASAGLVIAFCSGAFGALGSILGGIVADRLGRKSLTHVLYFIIVAAAAVTPLGIAMTLAPSLALAIGLMMAMSLLKSSYTGPAQGILLSLSKSNMRGVTFSMLSVSSTLLGYGVGPLVAGLVSTLLGGGAAIRYGLAILFLLNLWAAIHFWIASRTLERDLSTAQT